MVKDTLFRKKRLISLKGNILDLSTPRVMGILNTTPDSFYDGGLYQNTDSIRKRVNELLMQGATLLDVGAYSSRPGAEHVPEEVEYERLCMPLELIRKEFPGTIVSVDTFRSGIARRAVLEYGVDMINDISGGMMDAAMFETIADLQVPYLVMHMQGTPQTMQDQPGYTDVIREVIQFLEQKTHRLKELGVNDMLIDPGFGFGKTLEQNYRLLYQLEAFHILELPIVVGISRKSMIYRFLEKSPEEVLNGTTALHMMALERGADILRVHDVREAVETIKLFEKARQEGRS